MWQPSEDFIKSTNLYKSMSAFGFKKYEDFYKWSVNEREKFWENTVKNLKIKFAAPYSSVLDATDVKNPIWLKDARMNIIDSCLQAPDDQTAILLGKENKEEIEKISYKELARLINRISNSLIDQGLVQGDVIGIDMPMNIEAVAIYMAAIQAGLQVVTVADSFSPSEIKIRFDIVSPKLVFTVDVLKRGGKEIPMYEKLLDAGVDKMVVLSDDPDHLRLRKKDIYWEDFLSDNDQFESIKSSPMETTTILFSSGTTGAPKAIPWNHTTAIKSAADGYYHHDIQRGDVVAWPTNLGWMMGPWLIYATFINQGTMALYEGSPVSPGFGQFIQEARVNMLGVVPSMVRTWEATQMMEKFDWSAIKCFSSTGESSNPYDMDYLMNLAGNKPVIEYCGGTEIGGGYVTSTLIQTNIPSTFSTPALGSEFFILDENGKPADKGEVFLVPPTMGLSVKLLNKDHEKVYYEGTPVIDGKVLRRHGDYLVRLKNGYYRVMGRTDDSMNLGGIKVSAAQIEELINTHIGVKESAAIGAIPEDGGPAKLVLYIVPKGIPDKELLQYELQKLIKFDLNPLFKVHDVVITKELPRTASGKVMRRVLREKYEKTGK